MNGSGANHSFKARMSDIKYPASEKVGERNLSSRFRALGNEITDQRERRDRLGQGPHFGSLAKGRTR